MALGGRMQRYYINVGGGVGNLGAIRWGFRAPKKTYNNIAEALGVVLVEDNHRSGIVWGANNPRPARVRISYIDAQVDLTGDERNDIVRSVVRFCEPDKLNSVLFGAINDKKVFVKGVDKEFDIESVTLIG